MEENSVNRRVSLMSVSSEVDQLPKITQANKNNRLPITTDIYLDKLTVKPNRKRGRKRRIGIANTNSFVENDIRTTENHLENVSEETNTAEKQKNICNKELKENGIQSNVKKELSNSEPMRPDTKVNGLVITDSSQDASQVKKTSVTHTKNISNFFDRVKSFFLKPFSLDESTDVISSTYNLNRRNSFEQFAHLNLLTPAFILQPLAHGTDAYTKHMKDKLGDDLTLKVVSAHITDAINGRGKFGEARAIFKPPYVQKCFRIISSTWWAGLLYLVIAVHCLMMIWEQSLTPVSIGQPWISWNIHPAVLVVDAVCLLIYIVDVFLHYLFLTWRHIWHAKENVWIRVEIVFTVFFIIDFIILVVSAFTSRRLLCPFRCLRASMLLCKSKNVSHIFNVLLSIVTKLGKVFLIIVIFIVTFASIGLHIFMAYYHELNQECRNATHTWNCTNIYTGAFDNVANAALHMFVLMSTENYPEFIIPAYVKSWANFFYFGLYLYAGVFFLTAILVAIIVESYWDYSKRHVKQERRQQREELVKAWNLLDPLGKGQLSVHENDLLKLFHLLKPKNSDEENLELINYMSVYGDGIIDSFDWTTKLIEALSFEFEEEPAENESNSSTFSKYRCLTEFQKICRYIMHGKASSVTVLVLIFVHSILFCLMWVGITDIAQLTIQSIKAAIVCVFVIEVLLRVVADGMTLLNVFDVLDMALVLVAVAGYVAWYILWFTQPRPEPIYFGACAVLSGMAVLIRAVFNSQHARSAVILLRNIYPVMFDLILLVITIIFNFAVIGLEIFQDKTLTNSNARGYEGSYVEYGCGVGFNNFGCSLLTVFQIVTTNDWQEIMLGAMLDAGWPSAFYFLACYLTVDMIVMNLFVAISIEAYKKLAKDNTTPIPGAEENTEPDEISHFDSQQHCVEDKKGSFASTARNTFNEIFASSRTSKPSVGSNMMSGFASSSHSVRRGTLGSLGQRTPTPSPRLEESRRPSASNLPPPTVKVDDVDSIRAESRTSVSGSRQRGADRRHAALKERQNQRKRERRKTKQEEGALGDVEPEKQLQIEGIVRLKRAVRVIKSYHARNAQEMNLNHGEVVEVTEKNNDMLRGPGGWFPANHVSEEIEQPVKREVASEQAHPQVIVTNEQDSSKTPQVQFDETTSETLQKNPRILSPRQHRISQTRMKRRTDGADWRREIHGDMTVMNKDEMQDLSRMIRGGLERRHTSQLRNVPMQLALRMSEDLLEEEEEEQSTPHLTVSEPKPLAETKDDIQPIGGDTGSLVVPPLSPKRQTLKKKPKPAGDGSIPDWMQKFVNEKQLEVAKDVKLEENIPSSGEGRGNGVSPSTTTTKQGLKKKNTVAKESKSLKS